MGFLDKIKGLFARASGGGGGDAIFIYARCKQCGEVLRGRIDLRNELTPEYDDAGKKRGYFSRKVLIGSNFCFNQIEILSNFDSNKNIISQEVNGGELVDEEAYDAYIAKQAQD